MVEQAGRLGGKLWTRDLAGIGVETGADALLARVPEAVELVHERSRRG